MRTQAITFTGLTKSFSRVPIEKITTMQKIQASMPENSFGIAGKMPQDIIKIIAQNNEDPHKAIKTLFEGFAQCANTLEKIYSIYGQDARNFSIEPYLNDIFDLRLRGNAYSHRKYTLEVFLDNERIESQEKAIIDEAQKKLKEVAIETGLIPENGDVKIYGQGQGSFGTAFQIRFLDGNGRFIVHSKVMKVFPNSKEAQEDFKEARVSRAAFYRMFDDRIEDLSQAQYEKIKEEFREDLDSPMDTMMRIRRGIKRGIEESDIHGFLPETNRGLYLNGQLGKGIINTEFIPFYYADLRNSFFITEMSDMTLPRVSDRVALEKFGLKNTDRNIHNKVCDRLIDYGGIQISNGQKVNSFDYWEDSSSL